MGQNGNKDDEHLARTKNQLAGDLAHLQKLLSGLQRKFAVVDRATSAYQESRALLDRIDAPAIK